MVENEFDEKLDRRLQRELAVAIDKARHFNERAMEIRQDIAANKAKCSHPGQPAPFRINCRFCGKLLK